MPELAQVALTIAAILAAAIFVAEKWIAPYRSTPPE